MGVRISPEDDHFVLRIKCDACQNEYACLRLKDMSEVPLAYQLLEKKHGWQIEPSRCPKCVRKAG